MAGACEGGATVNSSALTTGMMLFCPETSTGTLRSVVIEIPAHHFILVDAFNMKEGDKIWLNRVSKASFSYPRKECCDPNNSVDYNMPPSVTPFRNRMALGKGPDFWALTSDRPQLIISIPGFYDFELDDVDMLVPMELYVEYRIYPNIQYLPAGYQGGLAPDIEQGGIQP